MCYCLLERTAGCNNGNVYVCLCVCNFFYFTGGRFLAVKGLEKCDFELLHVRSQFDQCLLQLTCFRAQRTTDK